MENEIVSLFVWYAGVTLSVVAVFWVLIFRYVKPYLNPQKTTSIYDMFPVERIESDGTGVTKDGHLFRILKVDGQSYDSKDDPEIQSMFMTRFGWITNFSPGVVVMVQSHRRRMVEKNATKEIDANKYIRGIIDTWNRHFEVNFRTTNYVILLVEPPLTQRWLQAIARYFAKPEISHKMRVRLSEAVEHTRVRLGGTYGVHLMTAQEVKSYLASLLNGRNVHLPDDAPEECAGFLAEADLHFPDKKPFQSFLSLPERHCAWVSIKTPPGWTVHATFVELLMLKMDVSVYQSLRSMSAPVVAGMIEDARTAVQKTPLSSETQMLELDELDGRVGGDDSFGLYRHRLAIQVFGDTKKEVQDNIRIIRRLFSVYEYRIKVETLNREAIFWSIFPGQQDVNPRYQVITNENACHFSPFPARIKGLDRCSFGDEPWCPLRTLDGDTYNFVPHVSEASEALGNVLIVGKSGQGKTVLTDFLATHCFKYPNFRFFSFDKLQGQEYFTRMVEGSYFTGSDMEELGFNPFLLPETRENKIFLKMLLLLLAGHEDGTPEAEIIAESIEQTYRLEDPDDRTFDNFMKSLGGRERSKELEKALSVWATGGDYGTFFSATENTMDFKTSRFIAMDMTTWLDTPRVLSPLLYYFFHCIKDVAKGDPFVFFADEASSFFRNEPFVPCGKMILDEFRKKNGVGIFAGQNLGEFVNGPAGESFRNNIGTYIIFPNANLEKADADKIGLSDSEFRWLTNTPYGDGQRQVLIKRNTDEREGVRVDIDLTPLGDLLGIFNSSASAADRIRNKAYANPDGFRDEIWNELGGM